MCPHIILHGYIALGDNDKAFEWFDKAGSIFNLKNDPMLDPIRDDPRFQKFIEQMNYPEDEAK
jgi:hypothetical protein